MEIDERTRNNLRAKHYGIVGRHSAVEICSWTKKAITGKGVCYKEKFYGVHSHKCAQISPMVVWCEQNCLHCWRPMEMFRPPVNVDKEFDEPDFIVEGIVEERKRLLTGFGGNENVSKERYEDSLEPDHWAISLSGEATLYPKLPSLIKVIKSRPATKTVFLVTNGQEPDMIKRLGEEGALPTQLYVSVIASNEKLYKKLALPFYEDGWERLKKTLTLWKSLDTRRVMRITLIKDVNDSEENVKEFASLVSFAQPHFVEVKAYMFLGYSRNRLKKENMPSMSDVETFASKLLKELLDYSLEAKDDASYVVLLKWASAGLRTSLS